MVVLQTVKVVVLWAKEGLPEGGVHMGALHHWVVEGVPAWWLRTQLKWSTLSLTQSPCAMHHSSCANLRVVCVCVFVVKTKAKK